MTAARVPPPCAFPLPCHLHPWPCSSMALLRSPLRTHTYAWMGVCDPSVLSPPGPPSRSLSPSLHSLFVPWLRRTRVSLATAEIAIAAARVHLCAFFRARTPCTRTAAAVFG